MKSFSGTLATLLAAAALVAPIPSAAADESPPLVVAHRGYTGLGATENTERAIRDAFARGADVVEFDIRFSKSDYPVVMHDATVDRTTTGTGRVDGMWVSQVTSLTTNSGDRVPTLAQALNEVRRHGGRALVELKTEPTAKQWRHFNDKVEVGGLSRDRIVIQSYLSGAVWDARRNGYKMARLLHYATTADWAKRYDAEAAPYWDVTAAGVAEMHAAGVEVYAGVANEAEWWTKLADMNVDQIFTDADPADVKAALGG